ncbi:hypothetical protein FOL47_006619 [Perkinsus chesapeaki]|uniref:Uncharacterized protein n=1 Tax=Perkinsus chesapeaki TaxID=330153 RepID=A0A7J6LRT2_PERCH|nr:hypothetical protein FOL47_006619 [Perkinsus chesapeaki]
MALLQLEVLLAVISLICSVDGLKLLREEPENSIVAGAPLNEEAPEQVDQAADAYWDGEEPKLNLMNKVDWSTMGTEPPKKAFENYRTAAKIKFLMPDLRWNPEYPVTIPDDVLSAKLPVGALSRFMLEDPGPRYAAMVQDLYTPDYMLDVKNMPDNTTKVVKRVSETQLQTDSGVDLSSIMPFMADVPNAPPPIDPELQYVPPGASAAARAHPVKIAVGIDQNGRELWDTIGQYSGEQDTRNGVQTPNKLDAIKELRKKLQQQQQSLIQRHVVEKKKAPPGKTNCDPYGYDANKKFKPCKHIEYRAASRPQSSDDNE